MSGLLNSAQGRKRVSASLVVGVNDDYEEQEQASIRCGSGDFPGYLDCDEKTTEMGIEPYLPLHAVAYFLSFLGHYNSRHDLINSRAGCSSSSSIKF